ncbi:Nn.00g107690.m01.CDS01 [Neocucurbitaria sp. VM-36]
MSMKNEQGSMDVTQKNVLNAPLHKHSSESTAPRNLPSSLHAGMCTSTHPIAATLTSSFLDFSASNGTDLRKSGVGSGSRFCISASQWKSAIDKGIEEVPRVKLESTHQGALESVGLEVLKKWAAEADNGKGRVVRPGEGGERWARESGEIGGKEPRA